MTSPDVQVGHIERRFGGHAAIRPTTKNWLQEDAGFPATRHEAEQRLVRRGHLDHHKATWQLMHFTRYDGVYGLERHARSFRHRRVCGLASRSRWLSSRMASSREEARQARASGSAKTATCTLPDVEALMGTKDTLFKVAMLNISFGGHARTLHRNG